MIYSLRIRICSVLLLLFLVAIFSFSGLNTAFAQEDKDYLNYDDAIDTTSVSSTDIDELVSQTDYYSSYYFNNLTTNFGYNLVGSCGYVAMGMLLSYWDTYWDNDVIPENYKHITLLDEPYFDYATLESPGIYREPAEIELVRDFDEYYQYIEEYSNLYFHLFLIKLGKEQFGFYDFESEDSPAGTYNSWFKTFFDYYLYTYRGYASTDVEVKTFKGTSDEVRQKAIDLVSQGIPVQLSISNKYRAHAVVAYDYDAQKDQVYVHAGWRYFTHTTVEEIGYDSYDYLTWLEFNNEHNCSKNFKYSYRYDDMIFYCPYELSPPNAEHNHSYSYAYQSQSKTKHKSFCRCGKYTLQAHIYDADFVGNLSACGYCGSTPKTIPPIEDIVRGNIELTEAMQNGRIILQDGTVIILPKDLSLYLQTTFDLRNIFENGI